MRVRTESGEIITLKHFIHYGEPFAILKNMQHFVPNAVVEAEDGKLYRVFQLNLNRGAVLDLNPNPTL